MPRLPPGRDGGRGSVLGGAAIKACGASDLHAIDATSAAHRYWARELEQKLAADGLSGAPGHETNYVVAQYDAIFSVGDRRNEVWIPLAPGHPWDN